MPNINKIIIGGHLGRDPETRYAASGTAIASFSVATSEKHQDKETTQWHRCVAFGKTAELVGQYLTKGSPALIEGRMQYRKYEGKDGVEREVAEVVADRVHFLSKSEAVGKPASRPTQPARRNDNDDQIPF
jgi:single-strand DNA-binding protein